MQMNLTGRPVSRAGAARGAAQEGKPPLPTNPLRNMGEAPTTPLAGAGQGGNALLAALQPAPALQPGNAPLGGVIPTQSLPSLSDQAAASTPSGDGPTPQLTQVGDIIQKLGYTPAEAAARKDAANYFVHALAPLVRQSGPITVGQLMRVGQQAVKDGHVTPEEVGTFFDSLPHDPASIRQAVAGRLNTALLTSIHMAGAQTPQKPEGD